MELRKEIESLALWYIPVFVIVSIFSAFYSGYVKDLIELGQATPGMTFSLLAVVSSFIGLIDNIVVGIWLYIRGKNDDGKAILWLFFGVVAHFYAALIYIGLKIYEQQKAYNNSLKAGTPESGAP